MLVKAVNDLLLASNQGFVSLRVLLDLSAVLTLSYIGYISDVKEGYPSNIIFTHLWNTSKQTQPWSKANSWPGMYESSSRHIQHASGPRTSNQASLGDLQPRLFPAHLGPMSPWLSSLAVRRQKRHPHHCASWSYHSLGSIFYLIKYEGVRVKVIFHYYIQK